MIPVRFVVHGAVAQSHAPEAAATGAGLCILDASALGQEPGAGKFILSVGAGPEVLHAFRLQGASVVEVDLKPVGLGLAGNGVGCAVGDFDNDGKPDLAIALSDRVVLFRNLGKGRFEDVTEKLGLKPMNHPAGITFVDFDHDGDLDLFVTGAPGKAGSSANVLWRNNGNMTFTEWTGPTALGGNASTTAVTISDLNNDRAIDIITAGQAASPEVYSNRREGAFLHSTVFGSASLPSTRGVAVADFNKDGWMDVAVSHAGAPGVSLWSNSQSGRFSRMALPLPGVKAAWGLTPIDLDNDGWIDLAALVETGNGTEIRVLRNKGPLGFEDVTVALGLGGVRFPGARSLAAVDLHDGGVRDLVIGREGGAPLVLANEGGARHHSMRIVLAGLADNKSAIGTKVEVFANGLWQKFELPGSSGYASQGALEIEAGLGSQEKADIVRFLWPSGVPQDELDVAVNKPLEVKETDRRGSSCPVLFAWDGKGYRFISDVIGAAVIGHWISPTAHNASDSDEWIKVEGSALQPRDGRLNLRFGEPMEEINYIDQLRLMAVDHPAGTVVYPNERFLSERPFADGRLVVGSPERHAVAGAWDSLGRDVRPVLAAVDHKYLHDFTPLPFAGFTTPHALTLDLGPWQAGRPLRLFLSGYIEYFSASSMYAAWQAGLRPEPPSVEAQLPDGSWKPVLDDMGFPAGLPRTIVVDLTGKLPAGTRRIRLRSNLQIYWDQIEVDNGADQGPSTVQTELPLTTAKLAFRGYPQQVEGAEPGDLTYDYEHISATGPFAWQRGPYTHFGQVTPLLKKRDDHYVIFGSGEEIEAEFDPAALPSLPPHWTRDYFFYADGFVKDMDFYEALPFTVAELPFHRMTSYPYSRSERAPHKVDDVDFQLNWNDRFESGSRLQEFDFSYGGVVSPEASGGTR